MAYCSRVSTPSAMQVAPTERARLTTLATMAASSGVSAMPPTNARSTFNALIG